MDQDINLMNNDEIGVTDIKQNPKVLLQLIILEDINNLKGSIETYNIVKAKGFNTKNQIITIKARTKTLFFNIRSMIKRTWSKTPLEYNRLLEKINHKDILKVLEAVDVLMDFLDDKKFIRIDSKIEDFTDVEAEAEKYGL